MENEIPILSRKETIIWRVIQTTIWAAGMFIWVALIFKPELGLHLLWNVLIPVAPALFVIAPGIWRNVCPLGSMSLAPHHFNFSKRKILPPEWRSRLYLGGFLLLIIVVPFRKVLLDTNGPILAIVLAVVGLLAIALGAIFNQKSAWCSSLCPVYPVELLYGSQPLISVPNVHCPLCTHCVAPCSESTSDLAPRSAVNTKLGKLTGLVLVGFFPGFVWGWYNVPTYSGWEGFSHLHQVYGVPYAAGVLTLVVYLAIGKLLPQQRPLVDRIFAASAIITYYWYRLPPVFGFGENPDIAIANITDWLPEWTPIALRIFVIVAFGYIMVIRFGQKRSWEIHPLPAKSTPETYNLD